MKGGWTNVSNDGENYCDIRKGREKWERNAILLLYNVFIFEITF